MCRRRLRDTRPGLTPIAHHRKRWINWLFASRIDGRIVIGQPPNPPLWIFIVSAVARWWLHPAGDAGMVLSLLPAGSLVLWSLLEIGWGVNPFRRGLGAVVVIFELISWL